VNLMKAVPTSLPDVLVLEPRVFGDERGFLLVSWNAGDFCDAVGGEITFVQDNQVRQSQGKLVRVVTGRVFDVAVDVRKSSGTFGRWVGVELSADNHRMLWIPPGFAHGFLVLSDAADFLYKTTDYHAPEHERTVAWNDPTIGITWPLETEPVLSERDKVGMTLGDAEVLA
jgi:dTDP-4-dehydrorhamnose 3,5-epimerase